MSNKISRRDFCQHSLLSSAAVLMPAGMLDFSPRRDDGPDIIDTYVNLFEYPFRKLTYSNTSDLVDKLRSHRIIQAWAGSFEALFHKNMDLANARLAEECRKAGGFLIPAGSVNLSWPDWEEDLRRCARVHDMQIVRVFPAYQMIGPGDPAFYRFAELATDYGMLIQIVADVEDIRHHHPLLQVRDIDFTPLLEVCQKIPDADIQLVHWNRQINKGLLERIAGETRVVFDISRVEGAGELGGLINGNSWYGPAAKIPAEKFLFGSHAPYFPVESALLKLFESPLAPAELQAVMIDNAKNLWS